MRRFVIGDIHSAKKAIPQILDRAGVTREDHLIFLGDYIDSWSEAFETVEFLIALQKTHNCTFIRGNHDELCKEWLLTEKENPLWLAHGGAATKASYLKAGKEKWNTHIQFYEALENTYVDDDNRLFLHAGFTNLKGIDYEYFKEMFYWDRTLWELAKAINPNLKPEDKGFPQRLKHYKEIFIGHTQISKTTEAMPQKGANVWNVDTGAAYKGALTIMDVKTKQFWQSDIVYTLYPGEKGRN